jgi:hypothetical protein
MSPLRLAVLLLLALPLSAARADQVIPDDLIVQSSVCAGFDCVDGESFGTDVLKLKENNLRILFDDTSATAGFSANDWRLTANDQGSGGASYFSIDDVTGGTAPFKVMAGAPGNALFVGSNGKIGIRESNPLLDLHLTSTDTPAMRLEQSNGGGFTAQTWDVGGNETSFFVRDLTGGSRMPLRIRPGAPTSSIDVGADGDVGIGTNSPSQALHVRRSDGTAEIAVEEASGTTAERILADLINNGSPLLRFTNTAAGATSWLAGPSTGAFVLKAVGGAVDGLRLDGGGDATAGGVLQQNAAAAALENATVVAPADILAAIRTLPIARFEYAGDAADAKHLAPGGADFRAALGLGASDNALAPMDVASAALAGVRELASRDGAAAAADKADAAAGRADAAAAKADAATAKAAEGAGQIAALFTGLTKLVQTDRRHARQIATLRRQNRSLARRLKRLEKALR